MTNVSTNLGKGLIEARRDEMPIERSLLVGISGIDASGKGYITARLAGHLAGFNVTVINVDGWLNLPRVRFSSHDPGHHFYENALRVEEMFVQLILPLREKRSIRVIADFVDETVTEFRKHEYSYQDIDIILLEGIFLFKVAFVDQFDLRIWIDCSFETALERAISRSQEGLPPGETIEAYRTIYFPAQQIHLDKDRPIERTDLIFENDQFKTGHKPKAILLTVSSPQEI